MKKGNLLVLLFATLFVVSGCKDNVKQVILDPVRDSTPVVDITNVVVEEDEEDEEEFEHKTCEEVAHGMIGGTFIETGIGRALESNSSYSFSFKPSTTVDTNYTVYSDDLTVAQIQREAGSTGFIIKTILQGDAIITAYDSNEMLVLRTLIKVRNPKSAEACAQKLYSVPRFNGLYYGARLAFTTGDPLVGVASSSDDFESTYIEFEAKNCHKGKLFDDNFNYWCFDMELNQDTSRTQRTFTGMYVSVTLDIIMIYYSDGLYDMFLIN